MRPQDYRSSHTSKGADYHARFHDAPHRAMLWRQEQYVLAEILKRYFPIEKPRHLDFACGTARVLEFCAPCASESIGVDISASMLDAARQRGVPGRLIETDITRDNVLEGEKFDLITAFRFFPNAEEQLRKEAMECLVPLLSERGVVVFNNHLNSSSLIDTARRVRGIDIHTMSPREVTELVSGADLRIMECFGLGILPLTDRHMVFPQVISVAESALARFAFTARFGRDQIFVAAHNVRPAVA